MECSNAFAGSKIVDVAPNGFDDTSDVVSAVWTFADGHQIASRHFPVYRIVGGCDNFDKDLGWMGGW